MGNRIKLNLEQTQTKLEVAIKALQMIKNKHLASEFGEPVEIASAALDKIALIDGF